MDCPPCPRLQLRGSAGVAPASHSTSIEPAYDHARTPIFERAVQLTSQIYWEAALKSNAPKKLAVEGRNLSHRPRLRSSLDGAFRWVYGHPLNGNPNYLEEAVMQRKARWASVVSMVAFAIAASQAQQMPEDYLDVETIQVKPERRAEFDALTKKVAAANRQNQGDIWIAMETAYGPGNRVTFISTRRSYAEIEKAPAIFDQALEKTYGKVAGDKMEQQFNQYIESSRSEIRRRRWNLSSNAPADAAAYAKLLGETRWVRTTAIHLKQGQIANWEALAKDVKAARDKSSPPQTVFVSQAVAGQEGTIFYVTTLQNSLAGFDGLPTTQQMLGDEGYQKFLKTNAEVVSRTETVINRFLPELSNAPEQVVAAAPDYWQPKPVVNAKAHAGKSSVVPTSATSKIEEKPQQ